MPPPPHDSPHGGSPQPPSKPKEKFLSLILKVVIMMFLISFFFLLLPLASFLLLLPLLLRHQRHRHHSHPSSGFSPKQIKKLPQFRFSEETKKATHLESDSCVICLDRFRQGQWCRNLVGCGHLFHRKCLDAWLMKVAACPICRTRVCLDNEEKGIWGVGTRRSDFQVC